MSTPADKWYTRPIFSVSNIAAALTHYCEQLGFKQSWKYEEDGETIVTQVNKGDMELILTSNLDRVGAGRLFVSLEEPEMLDLQALVDQGQVQAEQIFWGYPSLRVRDPDGNEMIFPLESE